MPRKAPQHAPQTASTPAPMPIRSLTILAQVQPMEGACLDFPVYIEPREGGFVSRGSLPTWSTPFPTIEGAIRAEAALRFAECEAGWTNPRPMTGKAN